MYITKFETMDINLLLSMVNMKLRNDYASLDELCIQNEIDKTKICQRLASADFQYDVNTNQFKLQITSH